MVTYGSLEASIAILKLDGDRMTRLVALRCASNAVGRVNPVKQICAWVRENDTISFRDAVDYDSHNLIDVMNLGCDFLTYNAYKFFGSHVEPACGRRGMLESIEP